MLSNSTRVAGVYVIRLSDTHYYGGRSVDCIGRWKSHLRALRDGTHENRRMQAVFNRHGRFEPEIVRLWWSGGDNLRDMEQRWLDENFRKPGCVNLTRTSDGGGGEWTEASREKRKALLENNPELKARLRSVLDKNRPRALILALEARKSPEARENFLKAQKTRRGVPQKPEHIAQRAGSHRGRKNTPETLRRMSESAKVRAQAQPTSHGEGTRKLISSQQRGRVWVHNATTNRRVWPHEARELFSLGWEPNRLPRAA